MAEALPDPELEPVLAGEPYIFDSLRTSVTFDKSGAETRVLESRIRVLSEAGVQQLGQLIFPFVEGRETLSLETLRVTRSDGSISEVSPGQVREVPAPLAANYPLYSSLKVLHVIPPALRPGDHIEIRLLNQLHSPVAPGQFFFEHSFERQALVSSELLELDLPSGVEIRMRHGEEPEPTFEEAQGRRILRWETSHLRREGASAPGDDVEVSTLPDIEISTFEDWAEVGAWYRELAEGRATPSAVIRKRVNKLLQGMDDDEERIRTIYNFVSKEIRYLGLFLGTADYQPHPADEVLTNGYGDCKDKHTLLQAMLAVAGYEAVPVLMSSLRKIDSEAPSPRQFNHMITVVPLGDQLYWMDSTLQVAPFGYLLSELRGKQGLLVPSSGDAKLSETSNELPFPSAQVFLFDGQLDKQGELSGDVEVTFRGDDEVMLRAAFFASPAGQQRQIAESIHKWLGLPGKVKDFKIGEPTATDEPLRIRYSLASSNHLKAFEATHEVEAVLPKLDLPKEPGERTAEQDTFLDLKLPVRWEGRSSLKLPGGFSVQPPTPVELKQDFAAYKSDYAGDGRILRTERSLVWTDAPLPSSRLGDYSIFRNAIQADLGQSYSVKGTVSAGADSPATAASATQMLLEKGRRAAEEEDYDYAIRLFTEVVESEPDHKSAWGDLGRALANSGDPQSGVEALHRQIEVNPLHKTARSNLAWSLEELGDEAGAEAAFREQLEVHPLNAYSTRNLGRLLEDQQRCSEAVAFLEKAVSLEPSDEWSKLRWARCLRDLGQPSETVGLLEELSETSEDAEVLDAAGYVALDISKPETAVTLYERALVLDPSQDDSLFNLAVALERAGRTEDAIRALQRLVDRKPDYGSAWHNLALLLIQQNRTIEGVEALRRLIEFVPPNVEAMGMLGQELTNLKQYPEAIEVLEKAQEFGSDDADYLIFLGIAYAAVGRLTDAIEALQGYLSEAPDDDLVLDKLGSLYIRQGNLRKAASTYQKLAMVEPTYPAAHSKAGLTLFELGEFDKAKHHFVQALEIDQNDFPAHQLLGIILAREERDAEALHHLERAKALAPGLFREDKLLEYVRGRVDSQNLSGDDD